MSARTSGFSLTRRPIHLGDDLGGDRLDELGFEPRRARKDRTGTSGHPPDRADRGESRSDLKTSHFPALET